MYKRYFSFKSYLIFYGCKYVIEVIMFGVKSYSHYFYWQRQSCSHHNMKAIKNVIMRFYDEFQKLYCTVIRMIWKCHMFC